MNKKYNSKHLDKKQRHLKKRIPVGIYCDRCPFWHDLTKKVKHKKELCDVSEYCDKSNCIDCDEKISYCSFLKYIEYGIYPLGDGCKVCGIKDGDTLDKIILKEIAEYKLKVALKTKYKND